MKLVLKPDVFPLTFVVYGGNKDFKGLFKELQELGVRQEEISDAMAPLIDDIDGTDGLRLNFGNVQAIWILEKLKWSTMDTYCHEVLHAVWAGMEYLGVEDQESWAYMTDYLVREITHTKRKK